MKKKIYKYIIAITLFACLILLNEVNVKALDVTEQPEINEQEQSKDHIHNFIKTSLEPTCTENGYVKISCECGETNEIIIEALGHSFSKIEIMTLPTEELEGEAKAYCQRCEYIETIKIEKLPHIHQYELEVISSTCQEQGYTKYTCKCGDTYQDNYTNVIDHIYGDWKVIVEPTETIEGKQEKQCLYCEEKIEEVLEKIAHEHYFKTATIQATCQEQGYTINLCSCGYMYKDNFIDSIEHDFVEIEIISEPTCFEPGEVKCKCLECGTIENVEISSDKVHNGTLILVLQQSTCITNGIGIYKCNTCEATYSDKILTKGPHKEVLDLILKEPTCYEVGIAKYACEYCKTNFGYRIIEQNHEWKTTILRDSTCSSYGIYIISCKHCGADGGYELIEPSHSFDKQLVIKEATCSLNGYVLYSCSKCGKMGDIKTIPPAHTVRKINVIKEPTCTEPGLVKYACTKCGGEEEYRVINPTHTLHLVEIIKEPTCTEPGIGKYACVACKQYQEQQEIIKNHSWSKVEIVKEPTQNNFGEGIKVCTTCKKEEVVVIELKK